MLSNDPAALGSKSAPASATPSPAPTPQRGSGGAAAARELRLAAANALYDKAVHFSKQPLTASARVKYSHVSRTFCAAADAYRLCGAWRRCGESLRAAAEAERAQLDTAACAALHSEAGDVFSRIDAGEASASLSTASGLYAALGRTLTAANLLTRQGELEEGDGARVNAARSFSSAADYFLALDMLPQSVALLWRAAANSLASLEFMAAHAALARATRLAADDNLTKFNLPKLLLNAALCLMAEWARRRTVEVEANRRRLLTAAAAGASRRAQIQGAQSATAAAAATAEALAAFEDFVRKSSQRSADFSVGRERRFLYDLIDAAKAWAAGDVLDHAWNFDNVYCFAPHELIMIDVVYRSIENGPPVELVRAAREAADMNKVEDEEVYEEVPVEVLEPMSNEELKKSGIMDDLEAEAAADREEEEADRLAEEEIRHVRPAPGRCGHANAIARNSRPRPHPSPP
jgi:hypothetical protein